MSRKSVPASAAGTTTGASARTRRVASSAPSIWPIPMKPRTVRGVCERGPYACGTAGSLPGERQYHQQQGGVEDDQRNQVLAGEPLVHPLGEREPGAHGPPAGKATWTVPPLTASAVPAGTSRATA